MKKIAFLGLIVLTASALMAHPHFAKTISAELPGGVKATISYRTTPSNETHAQNAAVGGFVTPRGPRLTLSGAVQAGSVSLAAGEYTIGVVKNSATDWTLALYPGRVSRGTAPDMTKVIKLDSVFSSARGMAEHLVVDIQPGYGRLAGKTVLSLQFGKLFLDGSLG